jgi:hypothetical protein
MGREFELGRIRGVVVGFVEEDLIGESLRAEGGEEFFNLTAVVRSVEFYGEKLKIEHGRRIDSAKLAAKRTQELLKRHFAHVGLDVMVGEAALPMLDGAGS